MLYAKYTMNHGAYCINLCLCGPNQKKDMENLYNNNIIYEKQEYKLLHIYTHLDIHTHTLLTLHQMQ